MDPISLTIGVIGLPVAIVSTVKIFRKTVQAVENAQPELRNLVKETGLLDGVFASFLDVLDEDPSYIQGTSKFARDLTYYTENLMKDFDSLRHGVRAVDRDFKYDYSRIERLTALIVWLRSTSTIKYLRASLSVARQSIIAFTNIRLIEKQNEELAHLRSALPLTEILRIESKYGMTVERRIEVVRRRVRSRRAQQKKIKMDLEEAVVEVGIHQKNMNDQSFTPETQPLLRLQRSINQYVDRVVVQDKADRRARRRYPRSSVLMSDSSATTPTQSTQPSDDPRQAPESPPTSPESSVARSPTVEIQPEEDKPSPTIPVSPVIEQTDHTTPQHACPIHGFQPLRLTPIEPKQIPSSRPPPDTPLSHLPEPDVPPADEVRGILHVDPVTLGEDEVDPEDGMSGEEIPTEQATGSKPSIWKNTTGVFEGDMPKSLRIRRQESRSP
ncbi:hypothetical protein AALT_g11579 [Alternaria alternata]|nr:hypothetical protein AALT_g11579 [Alternaria alternata]